MRVQVLFGRVLRRLRDDSGMSQAMVAERGEFDRSYIADLEAGKGHPSLGTFMRLADALGLNPVLLMQELVKEIAADPDYEREHRRVLRGRREPKGDAPDDTP